MSKLASYIDHTLLKPQATAQDIIKLCSEAREHHFASVCINSRFVALAAKELKDSGVNVCTVIGFPLGACNTATKVAETVQAVKDGAVELDMVVSVGALKENNDEEVERDIRAVVEAAGGHTVKVIIETCLLTDDEKVRACKAAKNAGAHFVKTSTGFSTGGATTGDVALMRRTVGDKLGVKASGGVRTREQALAMIEAGATRIGASAGIAICKED